MVHGRNRIPCRIDLRLSGFAGPGYSATISLGLPEDSQYGKQLLPALHLLLIIANAAVYRRQASNTLQGVDVTFSQGVFFKMDSRGAVASTRHSPKMPTLGVRFNTCLPDRDAANDDPDHEYRAYRAAMHEAGHTLGLSNVNFPTFSNAYEAAHPIIPDTALNEDDGVHRYHPGVDSTFSEPDCSPHPFDVLAVYALYQTVSRVPTPGSP